MDVKDLQDGDWGPRKFTFRACQLRRDNRTYEAIGILEKGHAAHPNDAWIASQLGHYLRLMNHHVEAVPYFEKALALNPRNERDIDRLSHLYIHLKRPDDARRVLEAGLANGLQDVPFITPRLERVRRLIATPISM